MFYLEEIKSRLKGELIDVNSKKENCYRIRVESTSKLANHMSTAIKSAYTLALFVYTSLAYFSIETYPIWRSL